MKFNSGRQSRPTSRSTNDSKFGRNDKPRFSDRNDKPRFSDRSERPRFGDRDDRKPAFGRNDKPRFSDRNDKPRFGDRDDRKSAFGRGEKPRFGDKPRFSDREENPRFSDSKPRFSDRNNDKSRFSDRNDKPRFNDRSDKPRFSDRDNNFKPRRDFDKSVDKFSERKQDSRPFFDREKRAVRNDDRNNEEKGERTSFKKPVRRTDDYDPDAKYSRKKQIEHRKKLLAEMEETRLNRFLANAGICSRREADEMIQAGVVKVNGVVVTELGTRVKRSDKVHYHDQLVRSEQKVYILLNKPKNCVTTSDDPQERLTVMDLVKDACSERIYPVGRLDRNTTGVLLLTNDGDMAAELTHPKNRKKKTYHVHLDKPFTKADMQQLADGITLEDGDIKADAISYVEEDDKKQVGIEVHSGRNRLVRRMFEYLGYKVEKLDRVYFAGLTKKGLNRGKWRFLTAKELQMLQMKAYA